MIGSGNAAEGELRPQLLDRFGLSVDVRTMADVADRATMVRDRLAYETNPTAFAAGCEAEQAELRGKLVAATAALKAVHMSPEVRLHISEMCSLLGIDGIRGDITVNRAARALVALEGREEVTTADVARVAGMCLNHRLRKDVLDEIDTGTKVALAWRRVTNPRAAAADAEAKAKAAEAAATAAADAAAGAKKAGSWGGLPGGGR
jgi:Mg-chelatase subunit ChlI